MNLISKISTALVVFFPARLRTPDLTPAVELESRFIFGFAVGSDIGPEGERGLESTTNVEFQKQGGSYGALEQEVELEYNPTDSVQIELEPQSVYHSICGVEGVDDHHAPIFSACL